MKKVFLLCAVLLASAIGATAQTYDVACPAGTSVLGNGQTINPTNGHLKAYLCVDGSGNVTSPQIGTGLAPNTPGIPFSNGPSLVYAANYGVKAQGQRWSSATWGSGTNPTVTVGNASESPFTSAMVGWLMFGTNGAATASSSATAVLPVGTITSFNSSTSVGVTPGSSAVACAANCQFFAAPNDDTAALMAAANAAFLPTGSSSFRCGTLVLPQGMMWISAAIVNNLWNCDLDTSSNGTATGAVVQGCGMNCSVIVPVPSAGNYNPGANNGSFFFTNSTRGKGWHYRGFSIDGLGQYAALASQPNAALFLNQNSDIFDVGLFGWGSSTGIVCQGGDAAEGVVDHVYDNMGTSSVINAGSYCKMSNNAFFWNGTSGVSANGIHVTSLNNTYDNFGVTSSVNVSAGDFTSTSDIIISFSANNGTFLNLSASGVIARVNGLQIKNPNASNLTGIKVATGAVLYLANSNIALGTGTGTVAINNSGTIYNLGGNSVATVSAITPGTVINNGIGEAGTIACAASAATITFKGSYLASPNYLIQDRTTAGVVTQTSLSATALTVGCPGATDNLNYTITPNGF